jgi:hypothetical protein
VNAVHPPLNAGPSSLRSAMDRAFDRRVRATSMPVARPLALRRMALVVAVVTVQVLVILGVVQSTVGLGYEPGTGIGPVPIPAPAPADASRGRFVLTTT